MFAIFLGRNLADDDTANPDLQAPYHPMATHTASSRTSLQRLGIWGWTAIVAIFAFLAASIAYAVYGWNSIDAVSIPTMGWVVLFIGIVLTLAVGGGLMALIFYSSRKKYDQEAHGIQEQVTPHEPE